MKHEKIKPLFIWIAVILVFGSLAVTNAQTSLPNQNGQQPPQNNVATQPAPAQNLPAALGFTPQQIQQWREINREFRNQEMNATFKLRQTRMALNEAMESQPTNEEIIKQRAKEVADAQSAVTQLQALRQARVLQMLTPEQRVKLKEIRERAQAIRQDRQGANALAPRQQMRRNANAPLLTPEQRKALRQQQKKNKP
ncbi:MAG TPA: periplasmic heavy metal sensor [Pyrinomonadaceae bacterium]|jgi:Spy/CpxP family protein refolding chaperone|nr:periplasmic heavy metal sensor [Pyrinomonadaceae bacterium]